MGRVQLLAAFLVTSTLASLASAQLPTATGRTIALSDSHWQLFIPDNFVQTGSSADVIFHFHGDPATFHNNVWWSKRNLIQVTVNYDGLSSAYQTPFSNTALFQTLMDDALAKARAQNDIPDNLSWRKVVVSSFSAGYGAVREILKQPSYFNRIDSLLAADSLYASYANYPTDVTPLDSQMTNYRAYALAAKNGTKTFIYSHSQVPTGGAGGYCSTVDCANDLLAWISATALADNSKGLGTLDFYRRADSGNFHLHGALGTDGDAHLEQLRYIGQFLQELPVSVVPEPTGVTPIVLILIGTRRMKRGSRDQA
jgi:hypothetical protein